MKHLLYLKIESDPYEVECNQCLGQGDIHTTIASGTCFPCQGTGKLTVRLVGMVEVRRTSGDYLKWTVGTYFADTLGALVELIIHAYKDGSLLERIRNQLKEERV